MLISGIYVYFAELDFLQLNRNPDQIASMAHTLKSTIPATSPISCTTCSDKSVCISDVFFGHAIHKPPFSAKGTITLMFLSKLLRDFVNHTTISHLSLASFRRTVPQVDCQESFRNQQEHLQVQQLSSALYPVSLKRSARIFFKTRSWHNRLCRRICYCIFQRCFDFAPASINCIWQELLYLFNFFSFAFNKD